MLLSLVRNLLVETRIPAGLRVHQFSVCMMASRAGDRTAGDLRLRFLRRAQLADVKAYACLEESSDGLQFVASQSFHYSCCLLQLPLRR